VFSSSPFICTKAGNSREDGLPQSVSDPEPPSQLLPPVQGPFRGLDEPPSPTLTPDVARSAFAHSGALSPVRASPEPLPIPYGIPCTGVANIPLEHTATASISIPRPDMATAIHTAMSSIHVCVQMIVMYMSTNDCTGPLLTQRKRLKRRTGEDVSVLNLASTELLDPDNDAHERLHVKQFLDLLLWHIGVQESRWYVKPRSTCWFDEYLFNIYTSDMFYDILRMRRRTFDRLVEDLRPYIQGQETHWRKPIGVEKKVVVTLFKLMHGASIPLVADRAALGKSTVHEILRQVCTAITKHLGHLLAWPVGRGLVRTVDGFQAKQSFPNCIGAIDGSHIYVAAPSNTIVAADHRNRNKSFSILLQGVVDVKCYFTSINTGPPGSLHDSAHFKSSELYRKVEEGVMGGFHDDPLTWTAGLPFPPYILADRGYPLLNWCITPFKKGPMGNPLSREEAWFNRKHSSTRMSVERAFGILKSRFREIGMKSSLKLDFLPTVVHACCILHNILLASKDRILD
jgi:hypothetical protein